MNYKPITIAKLVEFSEACPDYSLGEIFYSMFRAQNLKNKPKDAGSVAWLMDIDDKEFYTSIEKAIKSEQE